jgi:hypothetical protein
MVKSHKQILKQLANAREKAKENFRTEVEKASARRVGQQHRRAMERKRKQK